MYIIRVMATNNSCDFRFVPFIQIKDLVEVNNIRQITRLALVKKKKNRDLALIITILMSI